ncbi:MAG: alkaline phosphatase family protein [Chloroflexota bacterium]|nr:alkaline phosphatase family protein [Chloroflexota bacterium]
MAHTKATGKKAASNAAKVLQNPNSTKAEKSAAGSALSQVSKHSKKG